MLHEGFQLVENDDEGHPTALPSWVYGGLRHLRQGLPSGPQGCKAEVCVYWIRHVRADTPFVLMALHRDNNEMRWPKYAIGSAECAIPAIERQLVASFAYLGPAPSYRGWRVGDRGLQFWFELECTHEGAVDVTQCRGWRWALPSEIVNEGHVAGDTVAAEVRDDIASCPDTAVMYNGKTGAASPLVQAAYYAGPSQTIGYAAVVGSKRAGASAPFGEYYYLDSYERAVAALGTSGSTRGMIRYAVVVGRQTMLLGRETDRADASAMTRHIGIVKPIVRASSKARDADGKWARGCDSVGRGRLAVELGGTRHTMEPRMCVKDVSSFVPLEYCGGAPPAVSSTVSYTQHHEHSE